MVVIVAGMYRSGSTFVFNVVKEILLESGSVEWYTTNNTNCLQNVAENTLHVIIKSHEPDAIIKSLIRLKSFKCICTYRNPCEASASWHKTFGYSIEESVRTIERWINIYYEIKKYSYNINYEILDRYPFIVVLRIQKYITGKINISKAIRISIKYNKKRMKKKLDDMKESDNTENIGFSYFDKDTFYHRRHINSIRSDQVFNELSENEKNYLINYFKDKEI